MTDDIVARLRLYAQKQRETKSSVLGLLLSDAADEIERLRKELVSTTNRLTSERGDFEGALTPWETARQQI